MGWVNLFKWEPVPYLSAHVCHIWSRSDGRAEKKERVQTHRLWNLYKYVRYNTANNVSYFSMSGTVLPIMCQILVVIQWPKYLLTFIKWSNYSLVKQQIHCPYQSKQSPSSFTITYSPAASGGNLANISPNQVIDDFGRGSSVESESEWCPLASLSVLIYSRWRPRW